MASRKKKQPDYETYLKRFVIASLRRSSLYWPPRNEAFKLARINRGIYQCAICKKGFGRKEVVADHLTPVVKLSGFTDWQEYITRMFPDVMGFSIICRPCHQSKTNEESILRKLHKKTKLTKKKKK